MKQTDEKNDNSLLRSRACGAPQREQPTFQDAPPEPGAFPAGLPLAGRLLLREPTRLSVLAPRERGGHLTRKLPRIRETEMEMEMEKKMKKKMKALRSCRFQWMLLGQVEVITVGWEGGEGKGGGGRGRKRENRRWGRMCLMGGDNEKIKTYGFQLCRYLGGEGEAAPLMHICILVGRDREETKKDGAVFNGAGI